MCRRLAFYRSVGSVICLSACSRTRLRLGDSGEQLRRSRHGGLRDPASRASMTTPQLERTVIVSATALLVLCFALGLSACADGRQSGPAAQTGER